MLRFRRSKNIGPARLTLSKQGVGVSYGFGIIRIGRSPDGRKYITIRLPGTGLSYTIFVG